MLSTTRRIITTLLVILTCCFKFNRAQQCEDLADWADSSGEGCDWYNSISGSPMDDDYDNVDRCQLYGSCCADGQGVTARSACCVCGEWGLFLKVVVRQIKFHFPIIFQSFTRYNQSTHTCGLCPSDVNARCHGRKTNKQTHKEIQFKIFKINFEYHADRWRVHARFGLHRCTISRLQQQQQQQQHALGRSAGE